MDNSETTPTSIPTNFATAPTIETLISTIVNAIKANEAQGWVTEVGGVTIDPKEAPNPNDIIYIAGYIEDASQISFLFTRGLPDESVPSWLNVKLKTILPAKPEDSDSIPAKSAHLVLLKTSTSSGGTSAPTYRAGLEHLAGVSRLVMQNLLKAIIRNYVEKHQNEFIQEKVEKNGKKTPVPFMPGIGVPAHPSESLKKNIEEGRVVGLSLTKADSTFSKMDQNELITDVKFEVTAAIKPTNDSNLVFKAMRAFADRYGNKDMLKNIRVIMEDDRGSASARVTLADLAKSDAMDTLYSRSATISGFSFELPSCFSAVNNDVVEKISGLLRDKTLWD